MFEYTLLHWTSFLITAVVLNIAPGPDIAFIIGQTVRGGRKAGFGLWLDRSLGAIFIGLGLRLALDER